MTTPVEISYRTTQVQTGMLAVEVSATGTLQPLTQPEVSSDFSGVVRSVPTEENYRVAHGDTLTQLDATHILVQIDRAKANEAAAQARKPPKLASASAVVTGMLGTVAGRSLLAGGVGDMKIMLVSDTQHAREISVRLVIMTAWRVKRY